MSKAAPPADCHKMSTPDGSRLITVPIEIFLSLATKLNHKDLGSVRQTCKLLCHLCTPILFKSINISISSPGYYPYDENIKAWETVKEFIQEGKIFENVKCVRIYSPTCLGERCRDVARGLFNCSTSYVDEEKHSAFENQVKQLLGKVKKDHLRCFQWEVGFDMTDSILPCLAQQQKNLTAISLVDVCLHSELTPHMVTSALQDLELKSFSWIGLNREADLDVIAELARTQHNSLQDLQLIFTTRQRWRLSRIRASSSWCPRDTEYSFPVFQKLRSLSLANLILWDVSPEFVEKLNLANVYHLRMIECYGICDLIDRIADNQQVTLRLLTLEIELFDFRSEEKPDVPFPRILRRFTTLEDVKISLGKSDHGAISHMLEGLSEHSDLRRFLWDCDSDANNALLPSSYHHNTSFLHLCTYRECLALSQRVFVVEKLLPMIANQSLKMVHIRQRESSLDMSRGIEFVTQRIQVFNQTGIQEPLEDYSSLRSSINHYGEEGRELYTLALDLFRNCTRVPSLEVLAYGDVSDPGRRNCLLVVKDQLVPAGCTVISASELEARTTVKSPMSFLAAFNKEPRTFWRDTNKNKMGA